MHRNRQSAAAPTTPEPPSTPAEPPSSETPSEIEITIELESTPLTAAKPTPAATAESAGMGEELIPIKNLGPLDASVDTHQVADTLYELAQRIADQGKQGSNTQETLGFFAAELVRLLATTLEDRPAPIVWQQVNGLTRFLGAQTQVALNPDFWRDLGAMLFYQIRERAELVQRRLQGNYETDPYGYDPELLEIWRPFFLFLYHSWWRVQVEGLEHVPRNGRGMIVANHSGVLPWDGAMIATAVLEDHPEQRRLVRMMVLGWFSEQPFIAPTFASLGAVPGLPENAVRLLEQDQLICTFPEGVRGIGKPFNQRYQLQRFGRGGFAQIALQTGAPIIPVAVVGAEETYPLLSNFTPLAHLLRLPFFPVTLTFPWLGPVGVIPLPSRWRLIFCPPIDMSAYVPEDANNPLAVAELSEQVRQTIQETLNQHVTSRRSIFVD